jgi:hypothetical protein
MIHLQGRRIAKRTHGGITQPPCASEGNRPHRRMVRSQGERQPLRWRDGNDSQAQMHETAALMQHFHRHWASIVSCRAVSKVGALHRWATLYLHPLPLMSADLHTGGVAGSLKVHVALPARAWVPALLTWDGPFLITTGTMDNTLLRSAETRVRRHETATESDQCMYRYHIP